MIFHFTHKNHLPKTFISALQNDKLVSDGKEKTANVKVDGKGYISESTSTDDIGNSFTSKFVLQDCN